MGSRGLDVIGVTGFERAPGCIQFDPKPFNLKTVAGGLGYSPTPASLPTLRLWGMLWRRPGDFEGLEFGVLDSHG